MNATAARFGALAPLLPGGGEHGHESAAGVLAALCTATLALFIVASWLTAPRSHLAQAAYVAVYIVAAAVCWVAARAGRDPSIRWNCIALAVISVPIAMWVVQRSGTIGDVIALAFYPAVAIAVTPSSRTRATAGSAPELVDLVVLVTGVLTIIAYACFLVAGGAGALPDGLYRPLAPAAAVLVMMPAVLRLSARDSVGLSAGTGFLFSGLVLSIATDVSTASADIGRFTWSAAVWLMALGAMMATRSARPATDAPPAHPPVAWWPAAAAGGVYALLASQFARVEPMSSRILIIGATIVTALLLARQVVALRENQRLLERLAQHEKREAVGRTAADVAHEFNNLLTAMMGHLEILDAELPAGHPNRANLHEVRRASASAVDLTRSLLGAARQSHAAAVVDVNALVQQAASTLRPALGRAYEVRLELFAGPCLARGDEPALYDVLLNLMFNARDAMPGGGSISIATGTVTADSLPASLPLRPGDYVRIVVDDTGVGMSDEVAARAFDPFFTTKPEGQGTGLGLALVLSTVRRCGGLVDVASVPGRGSTFTIWLPQA